MIIVTLLLLSIASNIWCAQICCPDIGCFSDSPPFDHLPLPECQASIGITYDLFTRSNRNSPQSVTRTSIPSLYSGSRTTIFLIHGWNNNKNTAWLHSNKDALLDKADYNVIITGWGNGANNPTYFPCASNTRVVGAETAAVINNLVRNGGSTYGRNWCVGHSLGAHTCGHAGMKTTSKIDRITGLDPAGPAFEGISDITVGLNPSAATFVDVLHTDGSEGVYYGTQRVLGHADFYPWGGRKQPGCNNFKKSIQSVLFPSVKGDVGCSHGRAYEYFEQSVRSRCFATRQRCTNVNNLPGSCSFCSGVCGYMGFDARSIANGNYYLETSANAPYCLN